MPSGLSTLKVTTGPCFAPLLYSTHRGDPLACLIRPSRGANHLHRDICTLSHSGRNFFVPTQHRVPAQRTASNRPQLSRHTHRNTVSRPSHQFCCSVPLQLPSYLTTLRVLSPDFPSWPNERGAKDCRLRWQAEELHVQPLHSNCSMTVE